MFRHRQISLPCLGGISPDCCLARGKRPFRYVFSSNSSSVIASSVSRCHGAFSLCAFLPWVCKNLNFVVSFQMLEGMLKVSCFFARVWFNNCATLVLLSSAKNCCQSSYNYQVMSEMWQLYLQQVCIPVGCVPPACLTVSQHALCRGECISQHALGRGVCIPACTGRGGCLPAWVSARGGAGGFLWTEWQDRFKNITLPQLCCGR